MKVIAERTDSKSKTRVMVRGVTRWVTVPFEPENALIDDSVSFPASKHKSDLFREHLGAAMREERLNAGMVLRDFTGISMSHISEVERGHKEASSEILKAYCGSVGISVSQMIRKAADKMEAPNQKEHHGKLVLQ